MTDHIPTQRLPLSVETRASEPEPDIRLFVVDTPAGGQLLVKVFDDGIEVSSRPYHGARWSVPYPVREAGAA